MTISVQEAATSTMAILPDSSPASSLARTLSLSAVHGWSIADAPSVAHRNWMSGSDADARRSEVVHRIHRLGWRLLGSGAGNMNSIPVSADPGIFLPEIMGSTEKMREEGFPASSYTTLWSIHRQLYAASTDSSAFPPKTVDFTALAGGQYPDLYDALRDLEKARDEAREEEFPVPSDVALGNARRLLYAMYRLSPRRFEVYPMPDGEIAIDVPGGPGCSVLLLCGSDGGALCSVNMDGAHRRARYSNTYGLPDGFVRDALAELERADSVAV